MFILTLATLYLAQPPAPLPNVPSTPLDPGRVFTLKLDAASVRLDWQGGRWKLLAGGQPVKDFGASRADAEAFARASRDWGLTEYVRIGTGAGAFEYWLADGKAPAPDGRARTARPFDSATLDAGRVGSAWVLRDARQVVAHFGDNETDARLALAACRRFGFNEISYIGSPEPVALIPLRDPTRVAPVKPASAVAEPANLEGDARLSRDGLVVPGVGYVGARVPLVPSRVEVTRGSGVWSLTSGGRTFAELSSESDARSLSNLVRDSRVTDWVGLGDTGLTIPLASGRPLQSAPLGVRTTRFVRKDLAVKEKGGRWGLADRGQPVLEFADEATARRALAVIEHFRLDQVVHVGHPLRGGVRLLTRAW